MSQPYSTGQPQENERRVVCPAPAKINLALHVTGQRDDGYHELESLVVFCQVGDRLMANTQPDLAAGKIALEISGPFGGELGNTDDNLVLRAAKLLMADPGFILPDDGIHITLEKNLPVASGIGGGSADAAAMLLAMKKLTGSNIPGDSLMAIAKALGADVPMCLASSPLVARGIGERIEAAEDFPQLHLLLVNPGCKVSTPQVFAALKDKNASGLAPLPNFRDFDAVAYYLDGQRNDLEAPALTIEPVIGEVLGALRHSGARLARMSGSGATCFGLFDRAQTCEIAARAISSKAPDWWVTATTSRAFGVDRALWNQ